MMNLCEKIKNYLERNLSSSQVEVLDPQNDQTHLEAIVVSDAFENLSLLQQHRMVMSLLKDSFSTDLHALKLKTYSTTQWNKLQGHSMNPIEASKVKIKEEIETHPVILYMKGSKLMPQCGFSARVVQILNNLEVPYETRNVLEDEALRQGIKEFSDWPTIPQLYIKGEFMGGCDIVTELYESGELQKIVAAASIDSSDK